MLMKLAIAVRPTKTDGQNNYRCTNRMVEFTITKKRKYVNKTKLQHHVRHENCDDLNANASLSLE